MDDKKPKRQGPIFNEYGMTQWYWLVKYRENLELGKNTEIGSFTLIDAYKGVKIEDNVKIGWGAVIMSYSSMDGKGGKVVLKKNCGVGANATVMPGVTIGENSIVGANSLVNKDVPPNEIWFGNPAKFFKKRQEKEK
ncbi:acyltransferase [Candidatus Woesearchaeota archaeon]|nr:acyltransferase [Candidatus Woesearchaeota archaeon]